MKTATKQQLTHSVDAVHRARQGSNWLPLRALGDAGGFSLLEVVLSILIFAIGVSGAMLLQGQSLSLEREAKLRSTALAQANSMAALLHLQRQPDLAKWNSQLAAELPLGRGSVASAADSSGLREVRISWGSKPETLSLWVRALAEDAS